MRFRTKAVLALIAIALVCLALRQAGPALIVNRPQRSDVMVVLAGDTDDLRFWKAIGLLRAGYAPQLLVDARTDSVSYGRTDAQAAEDFIGRNADLPAGVRVCPTNGGSTVLEFKAAAACLDRAGAHSILIVTSDFHTRRALSIARKVLPRYTWSVAAADNGLLSTPRWWSRRSVLKDVFLEWQKLAWWELVDRHRS